MNTDLNKIWGNASILEMKFQALFSAIENAAEPGSEMEGLGLIARDLLKEFTEIKEAIDAAAKFRKAA